MNEKLTIDQAIQILHECNEHRRLAEEHYIAISPGMVDQWERLAEEAAFYLRRAIMTPGVCMTNSELAAS